MNHAIILAAGQGQRMNMRKDKLFLPVHGKPLVYYSIMAFNENPNIHSITIVANKLNKKAIADLVKVFRFKKVESIIVGGLQRQDSLEKGMAHIDTAGDDDIVLVHNAANPLPSQEEITQVIEKSEQHGACIVGHFATSTVKEVDKKGIVKTHNRKRIFNAETPQAAQYHLLKEAVENATHKKTKATDEAMMLEEIGQKVAYIKADPNNFKITTNEDYVKLKAIMGDFDDQFRVGIGSDSHSFDEEKMGLTLGGILYKDQPKLKANSDGDVILHAIFNAISQAIGEMSLGFYADPLCEKGVTDSKKYLEVALKKMKAQKLKVNSLGVMIEAKKPKIDPMVPELKKSLSKLLKIDSKLVGITATSGEELTPFGKGLGIQVFAIISLSGNGTVS